MRKIAAVALVGALGLTGAAGAALVVPALSFAAPGDSAALDRRVASLQEALSGLVSDGTLTQEQADEVASTLAERVPERGPGGRGAHGGPGLRGLLEAAESLGITAQELRAAAEQGTTLRGLADEQGVSPDALVDALVAAARERLAAGVSSGRLTRAEADERAAELETRITASLDEPLRLGRHGPGPGHGHDGPASHGEQAPAPSGSATPEPSAGSEDP